MLGLDDDINECLSFRIVHPHHPGVPVTFRQLLSPTAGLKENWDVIIGSYTIADGGGDSDIPPEEFVTGYFVEGGQWYDAQKNFSKSAPGEAFFTAMPAMAC